MLFARTPNLRSKFKRSVNAAQMKRCISLRGVQSPGFFARHRFYKIFTRKMMKSAAVGAIISPTFIKEVKLMINRAEIKQRSKAALSAGYWMLVITVFIAMVLGAGIPAVKIFTKFSASDFAHFPSLESLKRLTKVFDSGSLVNTLLIIFVTNVVSVGLAHLCMKAYRGETVDIADLFAWFREGRYLRAVAATTVMSARYSVCPSLMSSTVRLPGDTALSSSSASPYSSFTSFTSHISSMLPASVSSAL